MTTPEPLDALKEAIQEMISKMLPSTEIDPDEVKEEVWADLSRIYYKYEDEAQKKAFRDILKEISEKIHDDKWETVYKKIYREELKDRNGL
jgi:alpha-amylase/alpha-mannosidase (GH57 family)